MSTSRDGMPLNKREVVAKARRIIERIPPMPSTVFELRKAAADPNANYDHLVPILKKDPVICADLLRYANSARYGVRHKVETVGEAVRYFGMRNLIELVAASCSDKIVRETFSQIRNLELYFQHVREVSQAAAALAEVQGMSQHDREVYLVMGLMHDIGRLVVFVAVVGEGHAALGATWAETRRLVNKQEELYGLNHSELGAMILQKWHFPEVIRIGVLRHHNPVRGKDISIEGLMICLADIIAVGELPEEILMKALPPEVMVRSKIPVENILKAKKLYTMRSLPATQQ